MNRTASEWVFDPLTRRRNDLAPRMGYFPSTGFSTRIMLMGLREVEGSDYTVNMNVSGGASAQKKWRQMDCI